MADAAGPGFLLLCGGSLKDLGYLFEKPMSFTGLKWMGLGEFSLEVCLWLPAIVTTLSMWDQDEGEFRVKVQLRSSTMAPG